jgi:hypothetical protein
MYIDYGRNVRSPWQLDFVWWYLIFGGPSAWNLLHITLLAPRILRWLLDWENM